MKKIIKIIIILVLVALIAVGGYLLWQYFNTGGSTVGTPTPTPGYTAAPAPKITPKNTSTATTTNNNTESQLSIWGTSEVIGYYFRNRSAIALRPDGQVLSILGTGETIKNPATLKEKIISITPSFDGRWFIEKWGSTNNPRFSLFDVENNTWTTFSDLYFMDMDFSPNESKIVYLEDLAGKITLGIMDLTKKTGAEFSRNPIMSLFLRDMVISWPSSDSIILSDKPSYRVFGSTWKYSISTNKFEPLVSGRSGTWIKWDKKTGYGIQFSHLDEDKLEIINTNGETIFTSPVLTFPDKCITTTDILYCALPQNMALNKLLPDDYLKKSFYTNDTFYKFNLKNGEMKQLFTASAPVKIDAINLVLENGKLYFINRYDRKLYQLSM